MTEADYLRAEIQKLTGELPPAETLPRPDLYELRAVLAAEKEAFALRELRSRKRFDVARETRVPQPTEKEKQAV